MALAPLWCVPIHSFLPQLQGSVQKRAQPWARPPEQGGDAPPSAKPELVFSGHWGSCLWSGLLGESWLNCL